MVRQVPDASGFSLSVVCEESYLPPAGKGMRAKAPGRRATVRRPERDDARPYDTACSRGYSTQACPLSARAADGLHEKTWAVAAKAMATEANTELVLCASRLE